MDVSAFKVGSREVNSNVCRDNPPSKWKTYAFTIAIIVGIAGLAVGAIGLSGYFRAGLTGALSNMAQLDAIIMMAAGGGCGVILLIIGITGVVKNCKSIGLPKIPPIPPATAPAISTSSAIQAAFPTIPIDLVNMIGDYASEVLYGPEAWGIWKVEVLDVVPPVPTVDLSKKDKVLLYIPQRIRFNGKEQNLTLKALKEISGGPFGYFSERVEKQFGDAPALGGWVLIDRSVIPESRGEDYATQQRMVEERGCSMPSVLEACELNLMVFSFTSERLYEKEYTRCFEKVDGQYPIVVGGFRSTRLNVYGDDHFGGRDYLGVACVLRKFT